MKTIFDLRRHPQHGIVRVANDQLATHRQDYLSRFGPVGSPEWWENYDAGRISRSVNVGEIVHVGTTRDEFEEECDIVRIRTDRREIEYDREDYWLDREVVVGRWVEIEHTKVVVDTRTGPVTTIIDVRVRLHEAS